AHGEAALDRELADHAVRLTDEQPAAGLAAVVAEHVEPRERADPGAAIDVAADDGEPFVVIVFGDRIDQPGGRRRRRLGGHETLVLAVRIEEEAAFLHAPAVVAARLDDVDLLDVVLARVADPQLVGFGIDRYPERIPESVRVDFLRDFGLP